MGAVATTNRRCREEWNGPPIAVARAVPNILDNAAGPPTVPAPTSAGEHLLSPRFTRPTNAKVAEWQTR